MYCALEGIRRYIARHWCGRGRNECGLWHRIIIWDDCAIAMNEMASQRQGGSVCARSKPKRGRDENPVPLPWLAFASSAFLLLLILDLPGSALANSLTKAISSVLHAGEHVKKASRSPKIYMYKLPEKFKSNPEAFKWMNASLYGLELVG